MKAKQLLEILKECDPETDISFQIDEGCCGDWIDLQDYDFEHTKDYNKKTKKFDLPGWTTIKFKALPGYRSCIQSGATRMAHEEYWKKFDTKKEDK